VVHLETVGLGLVGADYRKQFVFAEKPLRQLIPKKVRTPPHIVILLQLSHGPGGVINWVRPHQIAEKAALGNLPEPIHLLNAIQLHKPAPTVLISKDIPP
jgi:hypothetical protein